MSGSESDLRRGIHDLEGLTESVNKLWGNRAGGQIHTLDISPETRCDRKENQEEL